jgi:hypothetical protein
MTFEQKLKNLSPERRRTFRLIERALKCPGNPTVERALQLARVACLGESMWARVEVQS